MVRRLLLASTLVLTGCVNRAEFEAQHAARVEQINARYDGYQAEVDSASADAFRSIREFEAEYLVPVLPDSNYKPVDSIEDAYAPRIIACDGDETCTQPIAREMMHAEQTRYYLADVQWVIKSYEKGMCLECLMAYSHNRKVYDQTKDWKRKVRATKAQQTDQISELRAKEVELSSAEMEADIEAEQRRIGEAVGAAIQAGGQAYAQGMSTPVNTPRAASSGCSSDFDCGIGRQCLKANYASSGQCVRSVNQHGTPTYDSPRVSSVGPKMPSRADCKGLTDCPVGFRCDAASGACLR